MSDELNSQLSAFVDDALTPEESELFVRRLCRDETLRQTAASYSLIGNILRGEKIQAPNNFSASIMMAVEGQSVPSVAPPAVEDRSMRHWGYALAASVALGAIALVTLPNTGPDAVGPLTLKSDTPATFAVNDDTIAVPEPVTIERDTTAAAQVVTASTVSEPTAIVPSPSRSAPAALIKQPDVATTVVAGNRVPARQPTTISQPPVRTVATVVDNPAQSAPALANNNRPARSPALSIQSFSITPAGQDSSNVPNVVPVNAENRARLNNLLLQHLNSSGALRQRGGVAFRNVGFESQTESQR